jgi:hypothetical protein
MDQAAASGAKLVCFAELAFEPFYPQRVAAGDVRSHADIIPGPELSRSERSSRHCRRAESVRAGSDATRASHAGRLFLHDRRPDLYTDVHRRVGRGV